MIRVRITSFLLVFTRHRNIAMIGERHTCIAYCSADSRQGYQGTSGNVHDEGPGHAGEDGPCVVGDCGAGFGGDEGGERVHVGWMASLARESITRAKT